MGIFCRTEATSSGRAISRAALLTAAAFLPTFTPALAADRIWSGAVSGDWTNAANWEQRATPTSADDVLILGSSANTPVLADAAGAADIVTVGGPANGALSFRMGATGRFGYLSAGEGPQAAIITISGAGTRLEVVKVFTLDSGSLHMSDAAVLGTTDTYLGSMSAPVNATVSGSGTVWNTTGIFELGGGDGAASLKVIDGAQVNGSISILRNGFLSGDGAIGSLRVEEGGTIAPGSETALAVAGDLFLASGSTYGVTLAAARQSKRLHVRGTVTISGAARLSPIGINGRTKAGLRYTLIEADGGITGRFDIPDDPAFSGLILTYEPNRVYLIAR